MSGDEEDESSSDEEVDEEMETELAVSLAFDDVEETIEMPQAPEDVPLPEIKPIEGIDLDIEDTCQDKCKRCLKDWKWKWVVCFLIIVAVMALAIHLLTEEHERLDAEINARTYRLDDVDSCALHPGIAEDPWALPPVLYFDDAGRKTFEDAFHEQSGN